MLPWCEADEELRSSALNVAEVAGEVGTFLPGVEAARLAGVGKEGAALRINTLATAVYAGLTVDQLAEVDFAYAPPFSPVIDPVLLAARVAVKKLG